MRFEEIIKKLRTVNVRIMTIEDLRKLFEITSYNTTYKAIERLIKQDILYRLKNGYYASALNAPEEFEIANYMYSPSYISLETALNFYGILSQFPYTITSVTTKKTYRYTSKEKEFEYLHLQDSLFFGYEKQKTFLMATPEKALIDELYLVAKGWRSIDIDDLDMSSVNVSAFKKIAESIEYTPFIKFYKALKL